MEELFNYIFGIYKNIGGNNPSILAPYKIFHSLTTRYYVYSQNKKLPSIRDQKSELQLKSEIDFIFGTMIPCWRTVLFIGQNPFGVTH